MTAETPWPILKRGSSGPNVTTLQYLLRGAGEGALAADGEFGSATETAVREFQARAGATVDGVVGDRTWTRFTDGVTLGSTVRRGSRGDFVRAAQNELLKLFYFGSSDAVDGIFGNATEEAVHAFQESVGIAADGVVGPRTWRELIGHDPE
ncbi:peptidoglycan-binding protein [Actinomadura sp. DC4]|uniref:peptidoglycan-binding domain-containing protein n=1 Tax=Actinomadura sp. DC4 TaxID=3055069 RepID=UPI0025B20787|nr:peptidoglycan-binding protein [Actinomadura sp. DC4]MDN3353738.1 peptidoglycan-binding protein [Actinomadura sp. DC4]